jgi:hypothetical protein
MIIWATNVLAHNESIGDYVSRGPIKKGYYISKELKSIMGRGTPYSVIAYTIYELNTSNERCMHYKLELKRRGNTRDDFTLYFPRRYLSSPTRNQLHKLEYHLPDNIIIMLRT